MKRILFFVIGSLLLLSGCNQQVPVTTYHIIPEPQEIVYDNGAFRFDKELSIAFPQVLASEAVLLETWLNEDFSLLPKLQPDDDKGTIVLALDNTLLPGQPEGYVIHTNSKRIRIEANSSVGILHGIQSLRQMIQKVGTKWQVQQGTVTDYPAFSWRAFMLDESRYFKGKEEVLKLLDEMAALKMNVFHWHLTDDQGWRIEIKKYPLLTEVGAFRDSSEINHFHSNVFDGKPHGGFYTQDEIRDIVAYAANRNIRVVPEIEMPGHASAAIAAYPWLGSDGKQIKVPATFGVHYNVYNVAGARVLQFLEDVLDEVIALFPDPVIHIGGDEVKYDHWKNSLMVQKYLKEHNLATPAELQVYFTNNISKLLAGKGRKMMGWNEITGAKLHEYQSEEDTDVKQSLEPGSIVHFWKGDPVLIKQTAQQGYKVVNSYHEFTYLDYDYKTIPLEKAYSFNPIPEGLTAEQEKNIIGMGCQMWGEFIPTVEDMNRQVYPRIAAYAECGWSGEGLKDYSRFEHSLAWYKKRWDKLKIGYYTED